MVALAPFVTCRAPQGMVTSVDHLASGTAVAVLRAGGTAVDAAVAANAVLAVTSQQHCGMGGDLFALVQPSGGAVVALNASGRAGSGADPDRLRAEGATAMPERGDVRSVPVPGCVDGWVALHGRFGRLPLADLLEPARRFAEDGFPASVTLAGAAPLLRGVAGADDLVPAGGPLRPGDRVRRPGVARALAAIARDGRAGFYEGEFGAALLSLGAGEYEPADLARVNADFVEPLRVRAFGHDVWTVPPSSQGYLTLAAAWIADGLGLPDDPDDPRGVHLVVEAAKQAGYDRLAVLHEHADGSALLDPGRLAARRAAIDPGRAAPLGGPGAGGGTMHLNVVDGDGTVVSLTQSNAMGFGAHLVAPGTGIFLQDRGIGFSLEPGHPAEYGPRRRPPHTLAPALVTTPEGRPRMALGTMGADIQPQILLQLLVRVLRSGHDPARAVAAPRWGLAAPDGASFSVWDEPAALRLRIEGHAPDTWARDLRARGHDVEVVGPFDSRLGHAHVITVEADHLAGAADPRSLGGTAVGC
jgi:gamma-glutamyltranspeptidase/glutathione hydrolase